MDGDKETIFTCFGIIVGLIILLAGYMYEYNKQGADQTNRVGTYIDPLRIVELENLAKSAKGGIDGALESNRELGKITRDSFAEAGKIKDGIDTIIASGIDADGSIGAIENSCKRLESIVKKIRAQEHCAQGGEP